MFPKDMRLWLAPHLAQLKNILRMAGLDTRIWEKGIGGIEPEDRVIQLRRYPLPVKGVKVVSLDSDGLEEQRREVFKVLGITPDRNSLLSRCIRCNHPFQRFGPAEMARFRHRVPVYILQTQRYFSRCERCGRIYWPGTHARNMIRRLEEWGVIGRNLPDDP